MRKILFTVFWITASSIVTSSCDKDDRTPPEENGPELMEEAVVYAGPLNNVTYDEPQTSITLEWKGHSLTPSTVYVYPPRCYIRNVTPGFEDEAVVYDVELTSVEEGGLNAAIFNFSDSGITQVKNSQTGQYEMVVGDFEIIVPMGIFESASVSFNPEQTIRFRQASL